MRQTIEIDVPKGMKAVYNAKEQKIEFIKCLNVFTWDQVEGFKKVTDFLDNQTPMGISESLLALFKIWHLRNMALRENYPDETYTLPTLPYYIAVDGNVRTIGVLSEDIVHPALRFPNETIAKEFAIANKDLISKFYRGMML